MLGSSADWCLAPTPTGGFTKDVRPDWRAGRAAAHRHGVHAWRLTGAARRCRRWRSTCTSSATTSCRSIASSWIDDWFGPGSRVPPRQPDCAASPNNTTAQGNCSCGDYGCRCGWWNEQKFKQSDGSVVSTKTAADLFERFHAPPLSMHFGGIRKPRTYSNKALCQERLAAAGRFGCRRGRRHQLQLLQRGHEQVAHGHARALHQGRDGLLVERRGRDELVHLPALEPGAADQYTRNAPEKRPFPAITWTGDGQSCTHEELLRGMLNSAPLTSCACKARRALRGSDRPRRAAKQPQRVARNHTLGPVAR